MSRESLIVISRCARVFFYSQATFSSFLYLILRGCGVKPGRKWAYFFLELRLMIHILVVEVMEFYAGNTKWYRELLPIYSVVFTVSALVWVVYFFEGSCAKKILACILSEIFSVGVLMTSWALVYRLRGAEEIFVMTGKELESGDFFVILIFIVFSFLCVGVLNPFLNRFRSYEIKHEKMVLCVDAALVGNSIGANMQSMNQTSTYMLTVELILGVGLCIFVAYMLRKQVTQEHRLYEEQQKFAENHLIMLQEQAVWVSENREQLRGEIQMMEALKGKNSEKSEWVQTYLEELKSRYENFHAGVYCNDRMVDALLCCKEKLCKTQGIETDFQLQKYKRGKIEERDVVKLLLNLLNHGIQSCLTAGEMSERESASRHLSLRVSSVKGQMLVEMENAGKQKFPKAAVKSLLKKYKGTLSRHRTADGWKIQVLLGMGENEEKKE